ncbi:zinc finger hit domain containing protein 2 protein fon -related [Holotrichia oblita]|uniref:Zinc finger hit domain containing protein 2 protein fon -related n=1 Tax=Holotrichia oblita TaxID=644536 RepID=A0ACB9SKV6_HOLOL|nr:zinc finger hit domain containing protein 2 protein fon -related [Holotrichia oblita]
MATARILELTEENICKLCDNALGKYTCPKCNVLYCSLDCYQSETHLQCSEQFYKDCVMNNLPPDVDTESKAKMLEVLKRMHEESKADEDEDDKLDSDDEDIDQYLDLGERLAGIDLDDSKRSEDVTKLIKRWEPWWSYRCTNKVLDIAEFDKIKKNCPKIRSDIMNFDDISKKRPADVTQYNLINILASYVFTLRYFNGEYLDFIREAVASISKISLNLNKNLNFNSFEEAVESVELQCSILSWIYPDVENMKLMKEDIFQIMQGPHSTEKKFYILCCLSDLSDLFGRALEVDNDTKGKGQFSEAFPQLKFPISEFETKSSIKRSIKKFEYFLSYVKDVLYV